jgi:hypothetical protein
MKMAWFLGGVFTFFCLVLVVCYGITKKANPVFVDQYGHPTNVAASTK